MTLSQGLLNGISLPLRSYLAGAALSNDASTPNTVIDAAAGQFTSDDQTTSISLAAINKSISSTWSVGSGNGGLDVGAVIASTWYHLYGIMRPDTGVSDLLLSQAPPNLPLSCTATNASPCVFTWTNTSVANGQAATALPIQDGCPVQITGTPPTGFSSATTYFVVNASGVTFELSAMQGGSAINSSSTGSNVVVTPFVTMPANYTLKRRIGSIKTDASSHIIKFNQLGDEFLWLAPFTDLSGTPPTSGTAGTLTVPPGVRVWAQQTCENIYSSGFNIVYFYPLDIGAQTGGFGQVGDGSTSNAQDSWWQVRTNISGQVGWIATSAVSTLSAYTLGYLDRRGKDN